jgi:HSP20 family protein
MGRERSRRNPFRGFFDYISEMNRMREHWMTGSVESGAQEDQGRTHASAWIPATDVFARGDDFVIQCELPGTEREDIEISLSNGLLTISGERVIEDQERAGEETYYVKERFRGTFRRTMSLPEGISEDRINAHFENGLLEVTVSGGAVEGPRRISIFSP